MDALSVVQKYFPEVTAVVDAKEPITVEVTQRDSKSATVRNHKSCALAVACQSKLDADGIIVSVKTCYVIRGKRATRYQLGESVAREIVSFDREAGFAPGEYQLVPMCPTKKLGAKTGTRTDARNRDGAKKRVRRHFTSGIRSVLGSREGA